AFAPNTNHLSPTTVHRPPTSFARIRVFARKRVLLNDASSAPRPGASELGTIQGRHSMSRSIKGVVAVAAAGFALAACSDINSSADNTLALAAAFQTVPVGFSASSNTFDASGDAGLPFYPGAISQPVGFHG